MVLEALTMGSADNNQSNEERIFSLLFKEDDITWQSMIYELVRSEEMDPWDINISVLAEKFLLMLKKMKNMDFRISGKMVLAAALLLKIKSERFMNFDLTALDQLINDDVPDLLEDDDFLQDSMPRNVLMDSANLVPRTPQPRQRKVSVYDLVEALEKALEVEAKKYYRKAGNDQKEVKVPEKKEDITKIINSLFKTIKKSLSRSTTISFESLLPSDSKEDKVLTFIPLLHLENQRKIELLQKEHFGPINIRLNKQKLLD